MLASALALASVAALAAARPISVALAAVETALSLPNTTQTNNATLYWQNGNAGACGLYSNDTDVVVGLPFEFYSDLGAVSPYCGSYLFVTNHINNVTTPARIADASATNGTLSLSVATWRALNGDGTNLTQVTWRFANKTEAAAAEVALISATQLAVAADAAAAKSADTSDAAASSAAQQQASTKAATTQAAQQQHKTSAAYVAPTTTAYVAPTTTTKVAPTTTAYVAPTTTAYVAPKTSAYVSPTTSAYKASSASSGSYSGTATYFTQGGVAGNCGQVHQDSDYIVALTSAMYSGGSHCGQGVRICTSSGKCISATVADSCPSCSSSGDLDLSVSAFSALASLDAGVVGISWSFA
ncbi:BZ3500_MvSof-1268-A1-R1_Chr1-3g01886 [Microbotryum saponariae]|uniref:BZ3500_MvSof-1268-A1-R1_Chr1-3g01886 protein n=1 Tax=Microbotryum saponariae TaxID=289078 RepID=A0A2X0KPF4_9BASI|nr:BZ3500_MvSof-1268-A1-R1_Chr1-3g01886 [Microbotryum saponariae]SCZ94827.1 BZ3501_MvSof-1269-A2-R1_Chr1-3g01488 [Microbotryum saponariae]